MFDRRQVLTALAGTGIGTPVFHRALVTLMHQQEEKKEEEPKVTPQMIETAQWICGTEFNEEEQQSIAKAANRNLKGWEQLRKEHLEFSDLPALHFQPLTSPASRVQTINRSVRPIEWQAPKLPETDEDIAFLPVTELSALMRNRMIRSVDLTKLYISRLKKYNPLLNCVVTITEELAMKQAEQADREIAAGRYRGPLHGIPWGAKDLIAVPGYPTTWGIPQFETRQLEHKATVAARLEQAGAVLVAKLALGAIAMGDKWFRGMTRSPWNYKVGSSGSSAGSASATVAGLVGFSLGSETLGSIVSPSRRCGATGHRPTFGRVSRFGCMPLSWTMDKIGPITRSVEDCALVFAAIHGYDGLDPTAGDWDFHWPSNVDFRGLTVGFTKRRQRRNAEPEGENAQQESKREDLEILQGLGCQVVEVELPAAQSQWILANTIDVEAACIFDEMLRARQTEGWNSWPGTFREAQFTSAIDYFRIQRKRRKLMFEMEKLMKSVDMLINTSDLLITNLTGHPSVVLPQGYRQAQGKKVPYSALITGRLNDDARLLALAHAYQQSITAHLERPPLDELLEEKQTEDAKSNEDSQQKDGRPA